MPDRPTLRTRISARLFSGASGGVFRGMVTLALGSGIGRIIGIASIPVLTRLYSPEDFGSLAVFTAFVQILIPLATLRYLVALPLPRSDRVAFALLALCVGLALAFSLATAGVLYAMGATLFSWFGMAQLAPYWWLLAVGMLGASLYETLTMWATRKRAYRVIARTQVVQSAFGEGLKILLGLLAVTPLGLLLGQVAGHSGGLGRLLSAFRTDYRRLGQGLRWRHVRLVARRYRGFPVYRLPAQCLLVLSMQVPLLFVAAIYGAGKAGSLAVAFMAILLPLNILSYTASYAYFAEASRMIHQSPEKVYGLTLETLGRLFPVAIIVSGASLLFSPLIFEFALGKQWVEAGKVAQILSISLAAQFLAAPAMQSLNLSTSQVNYIWVYLRQVIVSAFPFVLAQQLQYNMLHAVLIFSMLMTLHYSTIIFEAIYRLKMLNARVLLGSD